jgi:hypothetical protein
MRPEAPLPLRALQGRFYAAFTDALGEADPPDALGANSDAVLASIAGDERLSSAMRLGIYRRMYHRRLISALGEDYPTIRAVTGPRGFEDLVAKYVQALPPSHPSLRDAGRRLPAFLDEHPHDHRRWLADLARLEWARVDVFDGPDASPLSLEDVRTLGPGGLAMLPMRLAPSHALVRTGYEVDDVWRAVADGEAVPEPAAAPLAVLVWRPESTTTVFHRRLVEVEARALGLVERGVTFADVCEWLAREYPPDEEAARRAFELLMGWLEWKILVRAA